MAADFPHFPSIQELKSQELKLAFSLFDKNRDGFICLDELRHAMQALGLTVSESHLKDMFKQVDLDGNGLIDFDEFVQLMDSRPDRLSEDAEMRSYFAAFDKDNNGFIDARELKVTLGDLGMDISDRDVQEMMAEAGVEIKGRIYYEDFVRLMTGKIGHEHRRLSGRVHNNDVEQPNSNEDEETRNLRIAFSMFDKDGDGAITSTELLGVMKSLGYDTSTDQVKEMIRRVDLDGNGTIELDELGKLMKRSQQLAFITHRDRRAEEEEMRQAFRVFDKDSSGYIDAKDLRTTMSQLGVPLSSSDVAAMMNEAGVKTDGRIYYEDFVRIMFGQILKPMQNKVGDAVISNDELQEMKVAFALFDKDGDGAITTAELRSVMRSLGFDTTDKEVCRMIDRFDYDGNGTLEFDEFLRAMTTKDQHGETRWERSSSKSREPDSWRAFKMFDRDRNGYICASELKKAMEELGVVLSDEDVALMIKEADIDGDGRINYKEFVNMMEGNFQSNSVMPADFSDIDLCAGHLDDDRYADDNILPSTSTPSSSTAQTLRSSAYTTTNSSGSSSSYSLPGKVRQPAHNPRNKLQCSPLAQT